MILALSLSICGFGLARVSAESDAERPQVEQPPTDEPAADPDE
ncbi:MAG TPA: hypothetical protein VG755_37545 [Nannocystaceae bacterium]|nr:hypothetical protein [Nannocystaceae bacterium]